MSDALQRPESPLEAWPLAFRAMGERPLLTGAVALLSVPLLLVVARGGLLGIVASVLQGVLDAALAVGVCRSVLLGERRSVPVWAAAGRHARVLGWLLLLGMVTTAALFGIAALPELSEDGRVFWGICIILAALYVWLRLLLVVPALAVDAGRAWRAVLLSRGRGVPLMAGFVLVNLPFVGVAIGLLLTAGYLPLGDDLGLVLVTAAVFSVLLTVGSAVTAGFAARQYRRYGGMV